MTTKISVISPAGYLFFPHIVYPFAFNDQEEPQYRTKLLIPKDRSGELGELAKATHECAFAKWGKKALGRDGKINQDKISVPVVDGDLDVERDTSHGFWVLNSSSKFKVGFAQVFEGKPTYLQSTPDDLFIPGAEVKLQVMPFAYEYAGNLGVKLILKAACWIGTGIDIEMESSNSEASVVSAFGGDPNDRKSPEISAFEQPSQKKPDDGGYDFSKTVQEAPAQVQSSPAKKGSVDDDEQKIPW